MTPDAVQCLLQRAARVSAVLDDCVQRHKSITCNKHLLLHMMNYLHFYTP